MIDSLQTARIEPVSRVQCSNHWSTVPQYVTEEADLRTDRSSSSLISDPVRIRPQFC